MHISIKRKWTMVTGIMLVVVSVIIIMHVIFADQIDVISPFDLVIGLFGMFLAMYVYYKEKDLEADIESLTTGKINDAYMDILTNLKVFENTLDRVFVDTYKLGDTHFDVGDSVGIVLHNRNLRLVFNAHIDVMEKSMLGQLSQHISILEGYAAEKHIELRTHMDNMHNMDKLTKLLVERLKGIHKMENWMMNTYWKERRHNKFVLYYIEMMRKEIQENKDQAEMKRLLIRYHNGIEYYMDETPLSILSDVRTRLLAIEKQITNDCKSALYEKSIHMLSDLIEWIQTHDREIVEAQSVWVNQLRDYSMLINPLLFAIDMIKKADAESEWFEALKLRIDIIMESVAMEHHISKDERNHISGLFDETLKFQGSKDECLEKILGVKKYMVGKRNEIQEKHGFY